MPTMATYKFGEVPLPLRDCLKKDGTEKKHFVSREEAEDQITRAGWQERYNAYQCSHGHWHVGRYLKGRFKDL